MNEELERLLEAARQATRATRMEYRDPIANHGRTAIAALAGWLDDPEFCAFAIRTITKAGLLDDPAPAIEALRQHRDQARSVHRGDIDDGLKDLGYKPPSPGGVPAAPVAVSEDLYQMLVDTARARRTITYTVAGAVLGLTMRNPHHRRLLGQHLAAISTREAEAGRPMLSVVVVHKGENRTGTGFAHLGEELGLKGALADATSFDVNQLHAVFEYWSRPSRVSSTRTGAPDFRARAKGDEPPPAIGPCGFATAEGACLNPGRWDRDGTLSCTTHARAHRVKEYRGG